MSSRRLQVTAAHGSTSGSLSGKHMDEVQHGKHVDHAAAADQSAIKQEAPKLSPSTELQTIPTAEDLVP